ncbi:hypothetical protein AK88_05104 [Plasmodium fragile]|uniref:RRM domain-containing protein n=1 Tax=Plasmodium fragile TaxID=5857 RepID=A0A0D9QE58_PLAFR|nr:uncharacterized protein AK88_05104 [Plasmodium fragile]KJP85264.1 hypothetical protein AK88_05104 [Plasmodium fragile]
MWRTAVGSYFGGKSDTKEDEETAAADDKPNNEAADANPREEQNESQGEPNEEEGPKPTTTRRGRPFTKKGTKGQPTSQGAKGASENKEAPDEKSKVGSGDTSTVGGSEANQGDVNEASDPKEKSGDAGENAHEAISVKKRRNSKKEEETQSKPLQQESPHEAEEGANEANNASDEKKAKDKIREKASSDLQEKMKIIKEKLKSSERNQGASMEKHQDKDEERSKRKHKDVPSDSDDGHSSKRKRRSGERGMDERGENVSRHRHRSRERERSEEGDRDRDGDRSLERMRSKDLARSRGRHRSRSRHHSRSRYRSRSRGRHRSRSRSRGRHRSRHRSRRGRDRSKRLSNSDSDSSSDERHHRHHHKSRRRRKRGSINSSDREHSSGSTGNRNGYDRKDRSSSSDRRSKETRKKKKTKWDTVDENLLKTHLLDNSANGLLQQQNLALANGLGPNNKVAPVARNPYEVEGDKKQRKLYIGNIPPNSKQEELLDFFNNTLGSIIKGSSLEIKIGDIVLMPILKCEIFNVESRFCFLEFRSLEITWLCLRLDAISFNNFALRIARPHDFVPPPGGDPALTVVFTDINHEVFEMVKPIKIAPVRSTGDDDNKLYIQNLPHDLRDDQIRDLLQQFGKLKGFNVIKDQNTGLNKGYGFFEYEDSNCTPIAMHALNGFVCGQNILSVKKATFGKSQNSSTQNANTITLGSGSNDLPVSLLPNSISQRILSNSLIGLQIQASRKIGEKSSRVVQLTNAVFQEDLLIDSQYEEILRDVKEEAEKYGPLQNIVIPKPNKDLSYTEGVGKIFLHYADETTARKAQYMLNGRLFEKRVVCAAFYSEEKFLAGKYVLS